MKAKLIALLLVVGGSAFAETRFSVRVGGDGYGRGYTVRPYAYRAYGPAGGGAGYWGVDPDREHRRAEWYGLRKHQRRERFLYGDSPELREHQAEERGHLRHEQWHEHNGDYDAADGPAHGSARDGLYRGGGHR